MGFWQLGNTSVRSALRIKDGLTALSRSPIQGNIRKGDGDIAFRKLLGECGVVSLGSDPTNSLGRKWRSAMGKLGFIYPEIKKKFGFQQDALGQLDLITPAGWNLVKAETLAAIQECFLRAMSTPIYSADAEKTFSPLCWVLAILLRIEKETGEASISFIEMATIVQITTPVDDLGKTVASIIHLRNDRNSTDKKRKFDNGIFFAKSKELNCKPHTFNDYADMNIRYLKATGMVQAKGKGVILIPEKRELAIELTKKLLYQTPLLKLYRSLCNGAKLPTDDLKIANKVLNDLLQQIKRYGISYSVVGTELNTTAKINQVRYEIEELIAEKKEEIYAESQASQWQEIAAYMDLIVSRKGACHLSDDLEIKIPAAEAPAYFEWSLWRALLAIDSLTNKPYEVRRFNIDQDFLPICTAPGNGPDLIAEFDNCVIVVEVTLTESSRQEAMEGEPVRRHVADLVERYKKPVYGLFIANRIDLNTAETFRIGVWYTHDNKKLELSIIPLTLAQFCAFFKYMFSKAKATPNEIIALMLECEKHRRQLEAPIWGKKIDQIVELHIASR